MPKALHFRVLGTKCASCEIVLERELKTIPGVRGVHASHTGGLVELEVDDQARVTAADLEQKVGEHGYRFQTQNSTPYLSSSASLPSWRRLGAAAVIVLALYLIMKNTGLLVFSPSVEGASGLGAVFVIGLVAAFSSCTAVVGGLIVAVSSVAAKKHATASFADKLRPHLLFNIGRVAGFAGLGALTGWVGSVLSLSTTANGVLVLVIAAMMILLGINLLDVLPTGLAIRPPKFLSHRIVALSESKNPAVPFVLGAATYFLPCGFTQSMQLYALSTGDPLQAALIMTVFSLGTLPALLGIGAVTSAAKGKGLNYVTKAAGALVIVLGIFNLGNGANLLGWSLSSAASPSSPPLTSFTEGSEQVVQMEVTSGLDYIPDVITVKAGLPIKWEVYGANRMGCASTLVIPNLRQTFRLRPGYNELALGPLEPGTYPFTCSMGMTSGTLIVQ
jgi:sulfite exporter TauE/SafE/copper chaperone CopZ